MKRTIKTKEKPSTQPKLTKSQEIELFAIRLFEQDKEKALREAGPARKKFEAWKEKACKELTAKLATAEPSEVVIMGWGDNRSASVEVSVSMTLPKQINKAYDIINTAPHLLTTDKDKEDEPDDVKALSDWGYLCHAHDWAAKKYREQAKQKYQHLQIEGLVRLAADSKVSGFLDSVIEGKAPPVQFQLEG